jgi:hypothetical protein
VAQTLRLGLTLHDARNTFTARLHAQHRTALGLWQGEVAA